MENHNGLGYAVNEVAENYKVPIARSFAGGFAALRQFLGLGQSQNQEQSRSQGGRA